MARKIKYELHEYKRNGGMVATIPMPDLDSAAGVAQQSQTEYRNGKSDFVYILVER